jgi:hypothetical protein
MGELLPFLVFAGALAAVMGCFARLATLVRRRGVGGSAVRAAMASYDEAFRVTAHDSHYEIQAQAERKAPMPSPDDQLGAGGGRAGLGKGGSGSPRPYPRRPQRILRRLRRRINRRLRHGR